MPTERTVAQVINIARQWIEDKYADRPDFIGAHLVGSLHHMPFTAPFLSYRDVDLAIILDSISDQDIDDTNYDGLIMEAILAPVQRYESAEELLADSSNASIFAADHSVLLDPTGKLSALTGVIKKEYPRRKWVTARRDEMLQKAEEAFAALTKAKDITQAIFAVGELNMYLIATLTVVRLTPLTHRRNMLQLRNIIQTDQEKQIFEKLHQLLGSQHVRPDEAENLLTRTVEAFDYALTIHKTPVPYEHKLKPCIRPYLVEGTREMFNEDGHRESIFWITLFMMISCAAIQADAPAEEQVKHLSHARELLQTIGLASPEDIQERIRLAQTLLDEMKGLTDHIIAASPDILS
ncbi:MAG: hypothetical protein KJ804_11815 [Proteobacteria bacterium]|nr:hypothetical protein [Pseudomonadota bacterium]MBU1058989.1 hypothetical protein [Pseudomonadota bacterium]